MINWQCVPQCSLILGRLDYISKVKVTFSRRKLDLTKAYLLPWVWRLEFYHNLRSWTLWSLWTSSNLGYSMILTVCIWRWENKKELHLQIAYSLREMEEGISFEMRAYLLMDWNCKDILKMEKQRQTFCIGSHVHWHRDVSWARCWEISITDPENHAVLLLLYHRIIKEVHWSLVCAVFAGSGIVFPFISSSPKDSGLSQRYLVLQRNKSSVVPAAERFYQLQ